MYVDNIVEGIVRVMKKVPEQKIGEDGLPIHPYAVYNNGGSQPENLLDFVNILQEELFRADVLPKDYDCDAHKELVPMQPGDVPRPRQNNPWILMNTRSAPNRCLALFCTSRSPFFDTNISSFLCETALHYFRPRQESYGYKKTALRVEHVVDTLAGNSADVLITFSPK